MIREDRRRGVFVDGLSEWVVRSPAEVYGLMMRGAQQVGRSWCTQPQLAVGLQQRLYQSADSKGCQCCAQLSCAGVWALVAAAVGSSRHGSKQQRLPDGVRPCCLCPACSARLELPK
jgi:hypothetical protein